MTVDTEALFKASYSNHCEYPTNLIYRTVYNHALQSYQRRLKSAAKNLCGGEKSNDVRIRDFHVGEFGKTSRFRNLEELKSTFLDEMQEDDSIFEEKDNTRIAKDPQCRFVFLWALQSRDRLKVNLEALTRILSYHQVPPSYLDFLLVFGKQTDARESRMSGFRAQCFLNSSNDENVVPIASDSEKDESSRWTIQESPAVPFLGRSGKCYQISWNLKTVVNKLGLESWPDSKGFKHWSIRQAALFHQFDVENGQSLWLIGSGREDIQKRVEEMTGPGAMPADVRFDTPATSFCSNLKIMGDFCEWSAEGWRDYLRWAEESMEVETKLTVIGTRDEAANRVNYTSTDLQNVQIWEDVADDIATILDANIEILESLRNFYFYLRTDDCFPLKDSCNQAVMAFAAQVSNLTVNMKLQAVRARVMINRAASRKTLVVQYLQSQAAEEMGYVARESQKEAIAMRIIAAVTVLYLPATFVSTLFSTDIVKYQEKNGTEASFSRTAMMRWLQVSLPLTFLTMLAVGIWYLRVSRRLKNFNAVVRWIRGPKISKDDEA